jgi:DNA-binding GntR family transcriptional regulator
MYGNETIATLYEEAVKHLLWVRKLAISPYLDISESYRDHESMLARIKKGEVLEAVKVLVRHHERLVSNVKQDLQSTKPLPAAGKRH